MARKFLGALAVLVIAITIRIDPSASVPPYDDLYHIKRIRYSVSHFPHVLDFDRERGLSGEFCPWPPLYDLALAAAVRITNVSLLRWFGPIGFSIFAGAVAFAVGPIAGLGIAISPYLIAISRTAAIDHHWVEPILLLLIVSATGKRRPILLGAALTTAMFVQVAFLTAAAVAFALCFARRWGWTAFAIPAAAIAIYRLAQPASYPNSPWFLGWPHAACFAAAAIAVVAQTLLSERAQTGVSVPHRVLALAIGGLILLPFAPMIAHGFSFFGRDSWLQTIIEFQPMFRDPSRVGTDIANLTGGAILIFVIARRHRTLACFGIAYLLLAFSSRRFLVEAIPLLVIAGAIAAAEAKTRWAAVAAVVATLAPPFVHDVWAEWHPQPADESVVAIAEAIRPLPPGRVLAPWDHGHAIDVLGQHPVVIDNFGSMPDEALFARANAALRDRDFAWCRAYDIRYIVIGGRIIGLR